MSEVFVTFCKCFNLCILKSQRRAYISWRRGVVVSGVRHGNERS